MSSLKLNPEETRCLISGFWRSFNKDLHPILSIIELIGELSGLYIYRVILMYKESKSKKLCDSIYNGCIIKRKTYIQTAESSLNIEWLQRKRPLNNYCIDDSRQYLHCFGEQNLMISLKKKSIESIYECRLPRFHRKLLHVKLFHNNKYGLFAMGGFGDGSEWENWRDSCHKLVDYQWIEMTKMLVGKANMNVVDIESKYMFEAGAIMDFHKYANSASMYNYNTNEWNKISDLNNARPGDCGIVYTQKQNKVFLCGKTRVNSDISADNICGAEFYDFSKNKWFSDKYIKNDFRKCYHLEFETNGYVLIGIIDSKIKFYDTRTNKGWNNPGIPLKIDGASSHYCDKLRFCAFL